MYTILVDERLELLHGLARVQVAPEVERTQCGVTVGRREAADAQRALVAERDVPQLEARKLRVPRQRAGEHGRGSVAHTNLGERQLAQRREATQDRPLAARAAARRARERAAEQCEGR